VISMAEKMYIKQLYEDGVSKSEIQRRTKLNYCTVCKYADMVDWNDDKLPNMEPDNYPVLGEYILLINEWLEGEAAAPRKQRHTAKRIYDRLRAEAGYKGGYSSLKRYVCKKRFVLRQGLAGCLPLAHPMAHAQVDFGEFLHCDAEGNEHEAYELVMSFPYSDKAYAQVFPSQNQECLLIGMRRIFEYIGGAPARIHFYHGHALVASYRRCYGKNEELMDWTQYVRTLCRKPVKYEKQRISPLLFTVCCIGSPQRYPVSLRF